MLTRAILRSLCALLVGFLLVSNPTEMTVLLVQIIGGLFTLSGVLAFIGFFATKSTAKELEQQQGISFRPVFPVVGVGSLAFGTCLLVWPAMFVNILMYVLGVLLCLIGIGQIANLVSYRHFAPLSWSLFVLPLLIMKAGVVVLAYPMDVASVPFTILGISFLVYGVCEFIMGIRFYRLHRRYQAALAEQEAREAEAIEIIEDTVEDDTPVTPPTADDPDFPIDITR